MPKPYIIMPESHWVNALDAVREKTGTTGTISSEELAAEIGRISGSGIDTSDATATADKIFKDESAYVNGEKLIGTFTIDNELTEQNDLISQISTLVAQKATPPSTDTSDATATALDIAEGKSAYVKGEKVEGALFDYRDGAYWISTTDSYQWSDNDWAVKFEIDDYGVFDSSTVFKMDPGELASGIGLTADKIAEGETIMGIEGTHSGGSGGGGGVETCTVTINFFYGLPGNVWITGTQFIDNSITALCVRDEDGNTQTGVTSPYTLTGIVKNSALTITGMGHFELMSYTCTGSKMLWFSAYNNTISFQITEPTAVVSIYNEYSYS